MKILLVEDHGDTAAGVAVTLRAMGHEVRAAESCDQARAAVESEAFDLMLCDVALPDGDGCDLMRELRGRYGLRGVAMSARVFPEDRERCRAAGFSRFLAKPFDFEQLRAAVEAASRDRPGTRRTHQERFEA